MIKSKSVYENIDPDDGLRILVMRRWPGGIKKEDQRFDIRIKELGPSHQLLDDSRNKRIDFAEYERLYLQEMESQTGKIKELAELAGKGNITLLCCEKTDEECHRRLLKGLIERYLK